ncbi:MAG TPA: 5'/3'-nucleotidase SurE [Firmicutes bacterium]|nr:5'/3'-nucleotidase SurE [Bacillota bacterium]
MRVLVTNDDGIFSDGLIALTRALARIAEVVVVAPDRERSATGHAITVLRPLRVEPVRLPDLDVRAWAVDGTPSDCVKLAIEALLDERPDVLISGINRGPNLGTDVLYSGTVSAAVEGMILGVDSAAISVAAFENPNYEAAANFAVEITRGIAERGLPPLTILNINVPSAEREEIAGIAITRLGTRKYKDVFDRRVDPRGRTYYWLAGDVVETDQGDDVDSVAIRNRMISVTPICFNLTTEEHLRELSSWGLGAGGPKPGRP